MPRLKPKIRDSHQQLWNWQFAWNEPLGVDECPYVHRTILGTPLGSLRLHRWHGSDDPRAFHDHPWWFLTIVLWGSYRDVSAAGVDHLHAPAIRFRRAHHRHYVIPDEGGATTLLITGRPRRTWGFWEDIVSRSGKQMGQRFLRSRSYFFKYGHPPCSDQLTGSRTPRRQHAGSQTRPHRREPRSGRR